MLKRFETLFGYETDCDTTHLEVLQYSLCSELKVYGHGYWILHWGNMAWVFLYTLLEISKPSTVKDVIGCWSVIWIVCHHPLDHCSLRGVVRGVVFYVQQCMLAKIHAVK